MIATLISTPPRSTHEIAMSAQRGSMSAIRRVYSATLYFQCVQRDLSDFENRIGYTFQDRDLLIRALTHKSYSHEARHQDIRDNETFEFLGDSVLGFVIGDVLFRRFTEVDEGALSKIKAYLV